MSVSVCTWPEDKKKKKLSWELSQKMREIETKVRMQWTASDCCSLQKDEGTIDGNVNATNFNIVLVTVAQLLKGSCDTWEKLRGTPYKVCRRSRQ